MSTASAPLEIGRVALTVNDLATVQTFYEQAIGLERLSGSGEVVHLGAGDRVLLELREDRSARRSSRRGRQGISRPWQQQRPAWRGSGRRRGQRSRRSSTDARRRHPAP